MQMSKGNDKDNAAKSVAAIMKKKRIKILIILGIVLLGACYLVYGFYHPRIGSRSGRVVDAVTGEPIEGAVVVYVWRFSDFMTMPGGRAAYYEGTTDKDGRYFIPAQRARKETILEGVRPESVVIYKDGYAVYKLHRTYGKPPVGRSFGHLGQDQKYKKRGNLVRLYPWKEGDSHEDHVSWIDTWLLHDPGKLVRREMKKEEERAREEVLGKR